MQVHRLSDSATTPETISSFGAVFANLAMILAGAVADELYNKVVDPTFVKKHGDLASVLAVTIEELTRRRALLHAFISCIGRGV